MPIKQLTQMTEAELYDFCRGLAHRVEHQLPPGESANGRCLFFIAFTPTVAPGQCQYVSNIQRGCAIKFLRETADRLEQRQDDCREDFPEDPKHGPDTAHQ